MTNIKSTIPIFKLYGESNDWPTPDLIHCEPISARSSVHQHEIKPHQHADLYQLLYIRSGTAHVEVEGIRRIIREPSIQVVPPLYVHGFQFEADIDGYVLTLAAPLVAQLEAQLEPKLALAACYPVGDWATRLDALFEVLQKEYEGNEKARDTMLQALVSTLAVWLARRHRRNDAVTGTGDRARDYLATYLKLIEQHYREHWSVEQYAHQIGVSSTYLNNICRDGIGQTALQLMHQRLLLEAKRTLIYTTMPVAQIADTLGFADPAYFSRFFKRMTGVTANTFRQQRPHS